MTIHMIEPQITYSIIIFEFHIIHENQEGP